MFSAFCYVSKEVDSLYDSGIIVVQQWELTVTVRLVIIPVVIVPVTVIPWPCLCWAGHLYI
jgi:hypothetical protein